MAEEEVVQQEDVIADAVEHVIDSMEMEKGRIYQTYQSAARYWVEFLQLETMRDRVKVRAYFPQHAEWRIVYIDTTYKVRELSDDEQKQAYEQISRSTHQTRAAFAKVSNKPAKAPGTGRSRGVLTGLGMLETWGKYFNEFASTLGGRELIRTKMKEEFPNKHDSVDRWLDAYRTYYNKGRLPGVKAPDKPVELKEWLGK